MSGYGKTDAACIDPHELTHQLKVRAWWLDVFLCLFVGILGLVALCFIPAVAFGTATVSKLVGHQTRQCDIYGRRSSTWING